MIIYIQKVDYQDIQKIFYGLDQGASKVGTPGKFRNNFSVLSEDI